MAALRNHFPWGKCLALLALTLFWASTTTNAISPPRHSFVVSSKPWGQQQTVARRIMDIRGGSSTEEEEEEYETEDEEEDEDIVDSGVRIEMNVEKYDEPLVPSPMLNFYASIGVMLLARKVDLFSPTVVKLTRFAFVAFLVIYQLFLLYARIQAVSQNDRTPIELKSPLTSVLQSQLGDETGGNAMMKSLASSFLSSKSTVLEYDLKQIRSMQSGMIFNMLFMWILHFKMGQVQPLIIQSILGLSNLIYSPLFQVYGLGRNLERPFKTPSPLTRMQECQVPATETISVTDTEEEVEVFVEDETEEEEETDSQEEVEEEDDESATEEKSVVDEVDGDEDVEEEESVLVDDE
ncbi:hypothetical protein FisN_12Lh238 [Fistulifera solaris]|uniref:Reticulon domain-containing protein n=1 Tax=Fistulifera solaris TaxID=1519565 RepID=A0A1Z5JM29_FISSO|nr:hypothetical protein FisN_12Lh238 [Fistulifera solaris]|eukprot:GAX15065.1 hypothetical protein FisN_12Lh238 [Fistulifera solaris]